MNERLIFRYQDEQGDRFGDPVRIASLFFKGCEELDSGLEDLFRLLDHDDIVVAGEAMEKIAPIIATAFDVERFDSRTGKGLTVTELTDLLESFFDWQDAVKKNTETSPSSLPPTQDSGSATPSDLSGSTAGSTGPVEPETTAGQAAPAVQAEPAITEAEPGYQRALQRPRQPVPQLSAQPVAQQSGVQASGPKVVPNRPGWMPRGQAAGQPGQQGQPGPVGQPGQPGLGETS